MKRIFYLLVTLIAFQVSAQRVNTPVDYVNTLVGSMSKHSLSTGNTYPAIAMPWGMNFWTPQTGKMGDGWIYTYNADKIKGFKQTHQPSPWNNDYGQFAIMPVTGKIVFNEDKRASWFSHKTEMAKPHYYKVFLADHDITVELTPTERAAMFRFTFPEGDSSSVVIDAYDKGSYIKIIPEENKVIGYTTRNSGGVPVNFKNYFVIIFDKPFVSFTTVTGDSIFQPGNKEVQDDHTGGIISFSTLKKEVVHARVASSFISFEQAELNLKELDGSTFDQLVLKGKERWNEVLAKIEIKDDNIDNLRTFYSCLYRSLLFPRMFYEIDNHGNVIHYSPYNGKVLPGYMFTDTGFWDTFRCLFPFLNLMYPSMNVKMQEGLVNAYKESGFLPEWASPGHRSSMVGNNSALVVADAYLKGLRGYDIETLYEGLLHGTEHVHPDVHSTGRLGHEYYNTLGYIPNDVRIGGNVARTLEYANADWGIYQLGKALNRPAEELKVFAERAMNYKNLFDPKHNLMRARKSDGAFAEPFDPYNWTYDYTEGNAWHYAFTAFHDPQGLIDLMGGRKAFNRMLDSMFIMPPKYGIGARRNIIHEIREMQIMDMGQYAHGNQPIQHMIYLYNYSGEPWKTQYWVREVMDKLYSAAPDGYCGDEDNGQTSAWYVFSALGFYTVCPGADQYILGSPLFKHVKLHLENGNTIELNASDNDEDRRYVSSLKVNGMLYDKNYLRHADLLKGMVLDYQMSADPDMQRGTDEAAFPYSFSNAPNPF